MEHVLPILSCAAPPNGDDGILVRGVFHFLKLIYLRFNGVSGASLEQACLVGFTLNNSLCQVVL